MIIYMTLETGEGDYELEIMASGHLNPPNLLADNPDDYYGEIYVNWEVLEAKFISERGGSWYLQPNEIRPLEEDYHQEISEHVLLEISKAQEVFEE